MSKLFRLALPLLVIGVVVSISVWLSPSHTSDQSKSARLEARSELSRIVSSQSIESRRLDELEARLMAAPNSTELLRDYKDAVAGCFAHRESDKAAEHLVARLENVLHRLEPDVHDGTELFDDLVETVAFYRRVIDADRQTFEELQEKLNASPDDVKSILVYEVKVQRDYDDRLERAPDQAMANLSKAREFLQALKRKASDKKVLETVNDLLEGIIPVRERRGREAVPRLAWIGKKAAPLTGINAWVNGNSLSEDDLRGKVVLLDFFAVWCGPCISAFPKLRAWHDKYSDDGLIIVGITEYHNYTWDADTSSPTHASGQVPLQVERAMLERFAEHHELAFRFAVEGNGSLSDTYKVSGIPHVVLVDRQGIVRLVRTGASGATVDDIDKMIALLVSE